MFVCHKASLKTDALPGNVQLACSGDVLALPHAHNTVAVWKLADESTEVLLSLLFYFLMCLYVYKNLWLN